MTATAEVKTDDGLADGYERDLARRLHAAAIVRGKAEAELERTPKVGLPVAFRMRALAKVAQASLAWLRIYLEAVQHFQDAAQVDRNPKGHDPAEGHGRNDESPVAATSGDAPEDHD